MKEGNKRRLYRMIAVIMICTGMISVLGNRKLAVKAASDFRIVDGVLLKYSGPGGEVVIPEGVYQIGPEACF